MISILDVGLPLVFLLACLAPRIADAAPGDFVEADVEVAWMRAGEPGSSYGWAIADLGDVDDDDVTDLAVGAINAVGVEGAAGLVEVLSGKDGSLLWTALGEPGDQLGYALADAGDVDGDGVHDLLVGAPGAANGNGRVLVYSGIDGDPILAIASPEPAAAFGSAVASGGTLDDDEFADLLVGGELAGGGAGGIWAFAGADAELLWSVPGEPGSRLGSATAWVGDVDDDGIDDPFVGARNGDPGGRGYARLLDGGDGSTRFQLTPDSDGGDFGWFFVAGLGDLDGDDESDLYVGDFASGVAGPGSGRVHAYASSDGHALLSIPGTGAGEGLGPGRGAGDVDFDGTPDLLSGAYSSSVGANQSGRVFVFSGGDGSTLRTITSKQPGEQFGFDAIGLGDIDGDEDPDLAVAAAPGDTVYVIAGLGGSGGDSESDSGSTESGGSSDSSTSADSVADEVDGSSDAAATDDASERGCGCTSSSAPIGWLGAISLFALGVRRRRTRA